jgi:chemotaxis signal transduction protein
MNRFGLFQLGSVNYAIPLLQIRKILQNVPTYPLPCLPQAVSAVLVDADRLVPVVRLDRFFAEAGPDEIAASTHRVVVESNRGCLALPAQVNGRIVPAHKGTVVAKKDEERALVAGGFRFREILYHRLDINVLAETMMQGFKPNPSR